MTLSGPKTILDLVARERYEDALGLPLKATREDVHKAHIRLLYKYRWMPEIVEALNEAKSRLAAENDIARGRRLSKIGKNHDALPYLTAAVEQQGRAVDCRWLGNTLVKLKRYEEALPYLDRALEMSGAAGRALPASALPVAADHFKDSLAYAKEIEEQRCNSIVHRWIGSSLVELGRYKDALHHFKSAVELRGDADNHYWLGSLLLHMERYEEARPHLEIAAELRGDALDRELLATCMSLAKKSRIKRIIRKITDGLQSFHRPTLPGKQFASAVMLGTTLAFGCFLARGHSGIDVVFLGSLLFSLLVVWQTHRT